MHIFQQPFAQAKQDSAQKNLSCDCYTQGPFLYLPFIGFF